MKRREEYEAQLKVLRADRDHLKERESVFAEQRRIITRRINILESMIKRADKSAAMPHKKPGRKRKEPAENEGV